MKAKRENDLTVQKRVGDLKADTGYNYRFCTKGGSYSATGHFVTAPAKNSSRPIRFALAGDQDARPIPGESQPYWNDFQVWDRIRQQENDFNVLMGDTIYSDTEVPGYTLEDVALTVKQKWTRLQDEPEDEAVVEGTQHRRLLRPLGRPRVRQRLLALGEQVPLQQRRRVPGRQQDQRREALQARRPGVPRLQPGRVLEEDRPLPARALGQEPRGLLPRRALLPLLERRLQRRLRQPGRQRRSRPRADRPAEHAQRVRGDRAGAREPGAAGVPRRDQRSRPDDARQQAAEDVQGGHQEVGRDLQGDLQRGPDPAVLRAPLRPLGGLRGRAQGPAPVPQEQGRQRRLPDDGRPREHGQRRPVQHPRRLRRQGLGHPRHHDRPGRDRELLG